MRPVNIFNPRVWQRFRAFKPPKTDRTPDADQSLAVFDPLVWRQLVEEDTGRRSTP